MASPHSDHDQLSGVPTLDVPELLQRLLGDRELARIVLTGFLEEAAETTADIGKCFAEGNLEKVQGLAHTLKGTSSNVSAKRLFKLAQALEAHFKQGGTLGVVSTLVSQIPTEMDKLIREARAFIGGET